MKVMPTYISIKVNEYTVHITTVQHNLLAVFGEDKQRSDATLVPVVSGCTRPSLQHKAHSYWLSQTSLRVVRSVNECRKYACFTLRSCESYCILSMYFNMQSASYTT